MRCFFASDLHGRTERYRRLISRIELERPDAVFLGGDLLPMPHAARRPSDPVYTDFINDFLAAEFDRLRGALGSSYPSVFVILGNDDPRSEEAAILEAVDRGTWEYVHDRRAALGCLTVYGYACVPPTPFLLKDWERYDVSRFVDPGSVSPEEGLRSVAVSPSEVRHATIRRDLERLAGEDDLTRSVFLFHSPPYETDLDRAALDGVRVGDVPLDIHVGSVAIRRFIAERQPLLTLHGHIHESPTLTGSWRDRIGRTHLLSAAHDGPELALVRFDPDALGDAARELC